MVASQRVSRGFNRLGLFLAAMPLLVGGSISLFIALNAASNGSVHHQHLLCAHKHVSPVAPETGGRPPFEGFRRGSRASAIAQAGGLLQVGVRRRHICRGAQPSRLQLAHHFRLRDDPFAAHHACPYSGRLCAGPGDRLGHWRVCGDVAGRVVVRRAILTERGALALSRYTNLANMLAHVTRHFLRLP